MIQFKKFWILVFLLKLSPSPIHANPMADLLKKTHQLQKQAIENAQKVAEMAAQSSKVKALFNESQWFNIPAGVKDVGFSTNGSLWILGGDVGGGNYNIYRWKGGEGWEKISGAAARIAVDPKGNAWVVNGAKAIYYFDGKSFQPCKARGAATDVGVGPNGHVWVVGTDKALYKLNGNNWTRMGGTNIDRVAVDSSGNAWATDMSRNIFRFEGSNPIKLPGGASDIGIGALDNVFVIGTNTNLAGGALYHWEGTTWVELNGSGVAIAAGQNGVPVVATAQGFLFRAKTNFIDPEKMAKAKADAIKQAAQVKMDQLKKEGAAQEEKAKSKAQEEQIKAAKARAAVDLAQAANDRAMEAKKAAGENAQERFALEKQGKEALIAFNQDLKWAQGQKAARAKAAQLALEKSQREMAAKTEAPKAPANISPSDKSVVENLTNNVKKGTTIALSSLAGFKNIPLANSIKISEATTFTKVTEGNAYFFISGKASLFGLTNVKALACTNLAGDGKLAYSVGLVFEHPWSITSRYDNKIPPFIKPLFDILKINDGALVLSSAEQELESENMPSELVSYLAPVFTLETGKTPQEFSLELQKGINLFTGLRLDSAGPLKNIKNILKSAPTKVLLHGALTDNPKDLYLKASIGALLAPNFMPKSFKSVTPVLTLTGTPDLALSLVFKTALPPHKDEIDFFTKIKGPLAPSDESELSISGGFEGMWEDPFNIKGLSVGDVTIKAKITLPGMAPTFGMGGTIHAGKKEVSLAATIPLSQNLSSAGFKGSINEINFLDLGLMAGVMGAKVGLDKLPLDIINVKDAEFGVSGADDDDLGIKQGVQVKGSFVFNKQEFSNVDVNVNKESGVIGKASVKELKLGPVLQLTGDGPDRKKGTKDDGAYFDISVALNDPHIYVHGKGVLLGLTREMRLEIDRGGIGYKFSDKIWDIYQSDVRIKGGLDLKAPAFYVYAGMKADFLEALEKATDAITNGKTPEVVRAAFNSIFKINNASFEGSLEQLEKGKTPKVDFDATILGKRVKFSAQFDFGNAGKSIGEVAKKLAEMVIDAMEKYAKMVLEAIEKAAKVVAEETAKAAKVVAAETEKAATTAYNETKGAAVTAANATAKGATVAFNETKEFAGKAGNAIGGAANDAGKWVDGAAKTVGGAVGGAANTVGGAVSGAAKDTGKAIGGAAKDTGKAIGGAAKDTGKAISGGFKKIFSDPRLKQNVEKIYLSK